MTAKPATASELHDAAEAIAAEAEPVRPHASLNAALVAALADLCVLEKAHTANAGTYSYDYADLADAVKLTRPRLAAHGLVALTPVHAFGNGLACTVEVLHVSGETKKFDPFPFPHGQNAQATGSMVTYHRRYALLAALGLATGEDDDGAAAVAAAPAPSWSRAKAKQLMVEKMGAELAAAAWAHFDGDNNWAAWEADFPAAALEEWLNQPADPVPDSGETA